MANILKILLYREEEGLACFLTAFYEVSLDEIMIKQAIENDHFVWLNYVWVFQKNYLGDRANKDRVTFHLLFDYINEVCKRCNNSGIKSMNTSVEIQKVCYWKLPCKAEVEAEESEKPKSKYSQAEEEEEEEEEDNILKALLSHMEDSLALDFMGIYSKFLNKDLFLHSLEKNNKKFIQQSLSMGAFDKQTFKEKEVVVQMIEYMNVGSKTNFLLNILILTDVSVWKN
mmetsp:Transcript_13249/g.20707  ORF Transcript_13249/g.20707 Transcript_13249/m.20707 type:complete len:228 (+) Transcript_13249:970-1653(+)